MVARHDRLLRASFFWHVMADSRNPLASASRHAESLETRRGRMIFPYIALCREIGSDERKEMLRLRVSVRSGCSLKITERELPGL
jgi:hypothetical protein